MPGCGSEMTYMICCLLRGEVEEYQHDLVIELADRFGFMMTKKMSFPTHFTLKYLFACDDIKDIERLIERFSSEHKKTPVSVGGFGSFAPRVIFVDVRLSAEAEIVFRKFIEELRKLAWMTWGPYDGEDLCFHSSLAEDCSEKFQEAWEYVQNKEQEFFDCLFDNITILKKIGMVDGFPRWRVHKSFNIK